MHNLVYKAFLLVVFFGVGFLFTWNWISALILSIIIVMSIETHEAYQKGKQDVRKDSLIDTN